MSKLLFIKDTATGVNFPLNFFIPDAALAMADDALSRSWANELVKMELEMARYETAGTFYDRLFLTESAPKDKRYIGYKQMVKTGRAELLSRAATDFPLIDLGATLHTAPITPVGSAYSVNYFEEQEFRNTAGAQNIDTEGALASREAIAETIDHCVHFGGKNPDGLILAGFMDYLNGGALPQIEAGSSVYKKPLSTGDAGNTWALKTANEIYAEACDLVYQVFLNTKGKRSANKLVMGLLSYGYFSTKLMIDEATGMLTQQTAEDAFKKKHPNISIVVDPHFDNIHHTNSNETFSGQNAAAAFNDARTNYRLAVDEYNVLRPYEHKGFVTIVKNFGLVSSFMLKRPTDFVYVVGI